MVSVDEPAEVPSTMGKACTLWASVHSQRVGVGLALAPLGLRAVWGMAAQRRVPGQPLTGLSRWQSVGLHPVSTPHFWVFMLS